MIPDLKHPILLVNEPGKEEEAVMRLARVGYDNTLGYLKEGFHVWQKENKEIDTIKRLEPKVFLENEFKTKVLDVRKPSEYDAGHLDKVDNYPLDTINEWIGTLNPSDNYAIHCAGGYRSMIASSILKARGFEHVADVEGGYGAISSLKQYSKDYIV